MTRSELQQLATRLGGFIALTDIMLQIVKSVDSPLVRAYQHKPKGIEGIYSFFADRPGDPPTGFYLYTIEDNCAHTAPYDTLKLVYGYYAPESGDLEYTFPLIRTACGGYMLIQIDNYASNFSQEGAA